MEFIKSLSHLKNNKKILSCLLFFLICGVFLIFCREWGFDRDDAGVIYSSRITSWPDLKNLFCGRDFFSTTYPSNFEPLKQYFFNVFYRPLSSALFAVQYWFFDANAYAYFLVMIFLHALNSVFLFYLFCPILNSSLLAIMASSLFAFHPSLKGWMGWISAQPYVVLLFLLLVSLLFFISYLKNGKKIFHVIALLFYFLGLFLFELGIAFPIFLLFLFVIIDKIIIQESKLSSNFFSYSVYVLPFWFITFFFLFVRHSLYPLNLQSDPAIARSSFNVLIEKFQYRLGDFVTFMVEITNLSWIPAGNKMLKGGLALLILSFFVYLFYKNKSKRFIIFLIFSGLLFMWPAFLRLYTPRYFYLALPCYGLAIIFLLKDLLIGSKLFKFLLSIVIVFNMFSVLNTMKYRQVDLNQNMRACSLLKQDDLIKDKPICFVAVPRMRFTTALAQLIWIHGINKNYPIYYDRSAFVCFNQKIENKDFSLHRTDGGFRLTSRDVQNVWWETWGGENTPMGKHVIHKNDKKGRVLDMTFILDGKYHNQPIVFISWDYNKDLFKVLK